MEFNKRAVIVLLAIVIPSASSSCKKEQGSTDRQGTSGFAAKPAKWIAQYRSPASLSYSGVNLSVFYYSGISVVSPSIVFVCGDTPGSKGQDERIGVILRTTDGGQNWIDTPVELPGLHIPTLNAIHFISSEVGWAVGVDSGEDGIVLKTTDGGSSWAATRVGYKEVPTTVFFVDSDNGWIGGTTPTPGEDDDMGGPSAILATTDGGNTWYPQYNVPLSILRIFFVDRMNGWSSGTKGAIYNTSDGGRTWDKQRTEIDAGDGPVDPRGEGAKNYAIRGLQFIDKDHGFAAATATEEAGGRMLVTTNGGAAWRRQWMVSGAGVRDVFFLNPNEGWALTDQGPYINHTIDGGRTWLSEPKVFEQDVAISKLGGADAAHVWAVGGGAVFYRVSE